MKPATAIFLALMLAGLFFAADGYMALAAGGGGGTQQCSTGLCTTSTGPNGSVTTYEVTASSTQFVTTGTTTSTYTTVIGGSTSTTTTVITGAFTTTTTYNPSNIIITVSATPSSGQGQAGQTITFTASPSVPISNPVWYWNFGDGTSSTAGPTVSHAYSGLGSYPVTVVASAAGASGLNGLATGTLSYSVNSNSCTSSNPYRPASGGCNPVVVINAVSSFTGAGISGATVTSNAPVAGGQFWSGVTNANGQLVTAQIPTGTWQITVSAPSYSPSTQSLVLNSGGATMSFTLLLSSCGGHNCPESIVGGLFGNSPFTELMVGLGFIAVGGVGAALEEREGGHSE